jgi:integrase
MGKGGKERRVPLDAEVAGVIQAYLLAERPETSSPRLFVVARGPNRGQPLTPAGLRTVFRYHRQITGVMAGHPHALRHTFVCRRRCTPARGKPARSHAARTTHATVHRFSSRRGAVTRRNSARHWHRGRRQR